MENIIDWWLIKNTNMFYQSYLPVKNKPKQCAGTASARRGFTERKKGVVAL